MRVLKFLISFFVVALCATSAFADAKKSSPKSLGPDATLKEIVTKMKHDGNPAVVVEYVNWERAFTEFPEKQREQLGVKNAQDLRNFFFEMLAHPTATMKKQMEARLGNIPADKQEETKQSIAKIEEMMRSKEAELKERLSSTTYEVGEAKIDGNKATVKLVQIYKDQKRAEEVPLEKDGDRWLLPSVNMIPARKEKIGGADVPAQAPTADNMSGSAVPPTPSEKKPE